MKLLFLPILRGILIGLSPFAALTIVLLILITQPIVRVGEKKPIKRADAERLRRHVEQLAGGKGSREYLDIATLDATADYIQKNFNAAGASVRLQTYEVDEREYKNVVADFGPASQEIIVVGAHYDAFGGLPGADDNASGIAGLLELGRLLGEQASLPIRVELVAYTLEEPPFFRTDDMGSMVHAGDLRAHNVKVRAMICLEMIGFFADTPGSQTYPVPGFSLIYPDRANFISLVGAFHNFGLLRRIKRSMVAASNLPVRSINAPASVPGVDFSDHQSYWHHDYAAVMISDTAFYRNKNYHDASDVPGTLDYGRMAKVVDQVYAAVLDLATS